jgi:hypothetical protein
MSDALAIATITQVLMGMLKDIPVHYDINTLLNADVSVSALAPNRIVSNDEEIPRINLFLYRVVPNPGWCNRDLPSRDSSGGRTSNPPLALDLFYLMSVYGKKDLDSDILLGCAAQVLYETPVLTRKSILKYLQANPLATSSLDGKKLADQIEQVKISPVALSTEETSKLWTAFQAPCRSAIAYQVSVVLIDSSNPARSNLPVLSRGKLDIINDIDDGVHIQPGVPFPCPTLTAMKYPDNQPSAKPGGTVVLYGYDLGGGTLSVECRHRRSDTVLKPAILGTPTDTEISFQVPDIPFDPAADLPWPAGYYAVQVTITKGTRTQTTNTLQMAVAPVTKNIPGPNPAASRAGTKLQVSLTCSPPVLPSQDASIIVGDRELFTDIRHASAETLLFKGTVTADELPPGAYYYRIRIDGVESQLTSRKERIPRFDENQKVTIPP